MADLLESLKVDLAGATGITVIAPDGFKKSLPIEYVEKAFPAPLFFGGLDEETLGPECGLVRYPEGLPGDLADGEALDGDFHLMLAYERGGEPLKRVGLDVADGKITGEGPFRLVVPQASPGRPDRGSPYSPSNCGDGFDFRAEAEHNADPMVRGVIAVRVDPMPEGVEEFDYMVGGWAYVEVGEVVVYGYGVG